MDRTAFCIIACAWVFSARVDSSTEEKLVSIVFDESSALLFYHDNFGKGYEAMIEEGYPSEPFVKAKHIIVDSLLNLFNDPRFIDYYATLFRESYSREELDELAEFYGTPIGRRMSKFMIQLAYRQSGFPIEAAREHLGDLAGKLETNFDGILKRIPED